MIKVGKEVEGKNIGKETIFVTEIDELNKFIENKDQILKKFPNITAIYICNNEADLMFEQEVIRLSKDFYITIEALEVPELIPEHIDNFVLKVHAPDAWKLRQKDGIKIDNEDLEVISTTIGEMIYTHPSDFDNDIEVKING